MKYGWNTEDVKRQLDQAKKNKLDQLKAYVYTSMLTDIKVLPKEKRASVDRDDFFDTCSNFNLGYFNSSFFRMVEYLSDVFSDIELDEEPPVFVEDSPEEVISLCRDFYKRRDKNNLNYFKRLTNVQERIQFVRGNLNNPFAGRTYIISPNEYYVLVNGLNSLQDTSIMIHESKHVEGLMKGYSNGISLYQELPSYIYEMHSFDYLDYIGYQGTDVGWLRRQTVYKYVSMIRKMAKQINIIKRLFNDTEFFSAVYDGYEWCSAEYGLDEIYRVLKQGYPESTISNIISFVVGTDLYLNTPMNNLDHILSCYIFGMYKMKPGIIDGIVKYVDTVLGNPGTKVKTMKNGIDK